MHIYWYYPYPHAGESSLARARLEPGDRLTVEALRTFRGEVLLTDVRAYDIRRRLPEPPGRDMRGLRRVGRRVVDPMRRIQVRRRDVDELRPDVCHLHSVNYLVDWVGLERLANRIPLVTTVNDVRPHRRQLPRAAESALLAQLYRRCGHMIVFHDRMRDELVSDFGIDPARVWSVPLPFEPAAVDSPRGASVDAPDSGEAIDVLFFGAFRPNKGLHVLLSAAELLADAGVRIHIAGTGDLELQRAVRDASERLPGVTSEVGYVEPARKESLYRATRVVVLPYTSLHSQSGVLADAYAFARPVVASDVGAVGPTVRSDETGWLVPPGEAAPLAAAIREALATDPSVVRERMAEAAATHSPKSVGERFREIYAAAVEAF